MFELAPLFTEWIDPLKIATRCINKQWNLYKKPSDRDHHHSSSPQEELDFALNHRWDHKDQIKSSLKKFLHSPSIKWHHSSCMAVERRKQKSPPLDWDWNAFALEQISGTNYSFSKK